MFHRRAVLKEISYQYTFSWLICYIWKRIFNLHHNFPAWASLSNLLVWILHLWVFIQGGKVGFWVLPSFVYNGVPQRLVLGLLLFSIHRTSLGLIICWFRWHQAVSCRFSLMSLQSLMRSQTVTQTHPHGCRTTTSNLALVKQSSWFSQPSNPKRWIPLHLFLVKLLQMVQNVGMHLVIQPT